MKRPTLADVAREAGVSPTTVSRVLNNRGYLSEKTRLAVAEAMDKINYAPNAVARSLRDSRSNLIGIIFPSIAHPFYGHMAKELEVQLSHAGFKVLLCNSDGEEETELAYMRMLMENQVDAIITGAHSSAVADSPRLRSPLVTIDRPVPGRFPNVSCTNEDSTAEATTGVIDRGAQAPIHLTSSSSDRSARELGYRRAAREAGLPERVVRVQRGNGLTESADAIVSALSREFERAPFDAVVANNDPLAVRALSWAGSQGIAVPTDLQVIGFDGSRGTRDLAPHLSTVVQPFSEIASSAIDLIVKALGSEAAANADAAASPAGERDGLIAQSIEIPARILWADTTLAPR